LSLAYLGQTKFIENMPFAGQSIFSSSVDPLASIKVLSITDSSGANVKDTIASNISINTTTDNYIYNLSGTFTATGQYTLYISGTDANGSNAVTATVIQITSDMHLFYTGDNIMYHNTTVGANASRFEIIGGSGTYASVTVDQGQLPDGISIEKGEANDQYYLSGAPTTIGTYNGVVFKVTDSLDNTSVTNPINFRVVPAGGNTWTITASSSDGGTIDPSGASAVADGGDFGYTFIPQSGYMASKLLVDGVETAFTGNHYKFTNVAADHTINISFAKIPSIKMYTPIKHWFILKKGKTYKLHFAIYSSVNAKVDLSFIAKNKSTLKVTGKKTTYQTNKIYYIKIKPTKSSRNSISIKYQGQKLTVDTIAKSKPKYLNSKTVVDLTNAKPKVGQVAFAKVINKGKKFALPKFYLSKKGIIKIDKLGRFTALKKGTVKIKATFAGKKSQWKTVKVS
jgi:hypothetical protein